MSESRSKPELATIDDLLKDKALERVFSHYQGRKVTLVDKDVKDLANLNDFYNSDIVKAHLSFKDGDQVQKFDVVIKKPIPGSLRAVISKKMKVFTKENFWYIQGMPAFPELSDISPICYYGHTGYDSTLLHPSITDRNSCCFCMCCMCKKKENGLLVLQDLTKDNYLLHDKTKLLSFGQCKAALVALARFHGTWFRFLNGGKQQRVLDFTPDDIFSTFYVDNSFFAGFLTKTIVKTSQSIEILMKNRNEDQELIQKMTKYVNGKYITLLKNALKHQKPRPKFLTLLHADFWSNNMMFSSDPGVKSDDPEVKSSDPEMKVKLLDYQMMNVGHPAFDIYYFIYIGTDSEFRKAHFKDLMRIYFDKLNEYLVPTLEMSFEDFMQEMENYRFSALWGGMGVMANVLSPNQVDIRKFANIRKMDAKRHLEIATPDKEDDHPMIREIRRRLIDVVHEFDQLGEFDKE